MNRRNFLASSSTALAIAVAGCNSLNEQTNETEQPTANNTTSETPDMDNTTELNTDEFVYEAPESMDEIAAFGFNTHQERIRNYAFELDVVTRSEPKDGSTVTEQDIQYTYDIGEDGADDEAFFLLKAKGDVTGDAQLYSTNGFNYRRMNPDGGQIEYNKTAVDNDIGVFFYDGFNLIDQMHTQELTVDSPQQVNESVVRYPITGHRAYDSVSGHIDINLKTGLFMAFEFRGENSDEVYTMTLEYNYTDVASVDRPAWTEDMD